MQPLLFVLFVGGFAAAMASSREIRAVQGGSVGDPCKLTDGGDGVCRTIQSCSASRDALESGLAPTVCSYTNTLVVCCPFGVKAAKMCQKYAEAVFVWEILPLVTFDTLFGRLNSCALTNESIASPYQASGPHEFPHLALLGYRNGEKNEWLCGGSLISERYVLTTALCTKFGKGQELIVRLGDLNMDNDDERDNKHEDYGIEERISHPNFTFRSYKFDIGLVRLNRDVNFTRSIRPACLNTRAVIDAQHAIYAMWNILPVLKTLGKVNLTLGNAGMCEEMCRNHTEQTPPGSREDILICAKVVNGDNATSLNEYGSPLQLKLETPYCMYSIIGIGNKANDCVGEGNFLSGYIKVTNHLPWIESIVWPDEF